MSLQFTGPRLKGQDQRQNMLKRLIGFGFFLQLIVPLTTKHINLVYNTIFNNIIQVSHLRLLQVFARSEYDEAISFLFLF
ncbi:MAG TPA: hypothetical protein DHM44_05820 [Flexistipes sinusarabici]|uniref:Uncharacterized protein n=1 Tax=Flexistipes sinusarabici TaxID=2352 RepID=A0A3D5QBZ7_FLESI|nr:hypothetical protein [Flexistipes sinusarabici]